MTKDISDEHARYIHEAVKAGTYKSEQAALDEAVGLLKRRDQLRADVKLGKNQLDAGRGLDSEHVFDRVRKRANDIQSGSEER